jgi:hypothetical protein
MSKSNVVPIPKAGYPIAAWCEATNISRATFYTVKIGKRHIVIEAPGDFLRRVQSLNAKAA